MSYNLLSCNTYHCTQARFLEKELHFNFMRFCILSLNRSGQVCRIRIWEYGVTGCGKLRDTVMEGGREARMEEGSKKGEWEDEDGVGLMDGTRYGVYRFIQ